MHCLIFCFYVEALSVLKISDLILSFYFFFLSAAHLFQLRCFQPRPTRAPVPDLVSDAFVLKPVLHNLHPVVALGVPFGDRSPPDSNVACSQCVQTLRRAQRRWIDCKACLNLISLSRLLEKNKNHPGKTVIIFSPTRKIVRQPKRGQFVAICPVLTIHGHLPNIAQIDDW